MDRHVPEIMAPAGDRASFLAGVAAGADAVYLGLKHFSARMQAKNFGLGELSALTDYAHERGVRVYVAMNVLLKPDDARAAGSLMERLAQYVRPDALIVQDLGLLPLARQAGFAGAGNGLNGKGLHQRDAVQIAGGRPAFRQHGADRGPGGH